eukprot:TRINITY_DN1756_c0_g1_i1.p1 TRINITY_DN1756_c0_g1~~TRINITY_DN1756_c0_g1_i1.p1  ORF type:complete len:361 (-),score=19.50 TRINITY_DN1756_c0_g1_i1:111-1193(-)
MKMSAEIPTKKRVFDSLSTERLFWYEVVCGLDKDYIILEGKGNMLIVDIKAAIYEKLPELLKTKYGATDKRSLVLTHNGTILTDGTVVAKSASTIYSNTHPAIVSWPGSENLVRLLRALERLEKSLLPFSPIEIGTLCHSTILSDRLLGMIDKEKYQPYLSTSEIAERAKTSKAKMLKQSLVITSEAGMATALYIFLNHALLKTPHLAHVKIDPECVIKQEFYKKKKIRYEADLTVYDAVENIIVFVTEAKLKKFHGILDAIKQNVEQLRLYAFAQNVQKVYGIATTYSEWVIIHYECKPDGEEAVEMTKLVSIGDYQVEDMGQVEHLIKLLRATLCLAYEAKSVPFTQIANELFYDDPQ